MTRYEETLAIPHILKNIIASLKDYGEDEWVKYFEDLLLRLETGIEHPSIYQRLIREILSLYKGMGSFSDLLLARNGEFLKAETNRLAELRTDLFEAARSELR